MVTDLVEACARAIGFDDEAVTRFWGYVDKHKGGCWTWKGAINHQGYGRFYLRRKSMPAHRAAMLISGREMPEGLVCDHLCRNRACVNPNHIEMVTHAENVLRGVGPSALRAAQTHCQNGHELSGDNLRIVNGKHRRCRTCLAIKERDRRKKVSASVGRRPCMSAYSEKGWKKISKAQADEIAKSNLPRSEICKKFGITRNFVRLIQCGKASILALEPEAQS